MTQDELILCADASGISIFAMGMDRKEFLRRLDAFTNLVAAKEREACAKVCETHGVYPELNVWNGGPDWYKHGKDCATAIRARGKQA